MKKVMPVAVAVCLVVNAELRAQGWTYYSPYTSNSSGNSAGQVFGVPGSNLYHAAVKVGGVEARLPEPADATSSFGYCISPDSKWVGGMSQTAAGARSVVRWKFEAGTWTLHAVAALPAGTYFAFPLSIGNDGTAVVSGYASTGYFAYAWPVTVAFRAGGGSELVPLPLPAGTTSQPAAPAAMPAAVPVGSGDACTNCGCQGVPAFVPTENPRQGFFRRLFRR